MHLKNFKFLGNDSIKVILFINTDNLLFKHIRYILIAIGYNIEKSIRNART